jgi:hypothetical protein
VPGGGCSAGRCACPCSRSTLPVDGTDRGRAAGLLNVLWTERAGPRWCSAVCAQGTNRRRTRFLPGYAAP